MKVLTRIFKEEAIPNYYNRQEQYASPYMSTNVGKRLPLEEPLLIILEVTGHLMALRPARAIGQSFSLI